MMGLDMDSEEPYLIFNNLREHEVEELHTVNESLT